MMRNVSAVTLCALFLLIARPLVGETLPLLRTSGLCAAAVAGNTPLTGAGLANDSIAVSSSIAMADASLTPTTNSTTAYSAQSSSAAQEISNDDYTLRAECAASAVFQVQPGIGSDPGGWLTSTLLLTVSELNSSAAGSAQFGAVGIAYQGGATFYFINGGSSFNFIDDESSLVINQYVYLYENVGLATWALAGEMNTGWSATDISTLAAGSVESDEEPTVPDTITVFKEGEDPVVIEF